MTDTEHVLELASQAHDRGLLPDVPANEAEEDALYIVARLLNDASSVEMHDLRIAEGYLDRLVNAAR